MAKPITSVDYSLTLTLLPKVMKLLNLEHQHDLILKTLPQIRHDMRMVKISCILELTKSKNYHIHMICNFNMDHYKYLRKRIIITIKDYFRNHHVFGFTDISQVQSYEKWTLYMLKDIYNTYHQTGYYPLIWDEYDLFEHKFKFFDQYHLQDIKELDKLL